MILSKPHYSEKFSAAVAYEKTVAVLHAVVRRGRAWQQRERERRLIAAMGERDFKDFGMTRERMEFELESRRARALRRL
jgi:uncharacterized protein YjiS (DUF1127 family)